MRKKIVPCLFALLLCANVQTLFAQNPTERKITTIQITDKDSLMYNKTDSVPPPVITHHKITLDGKTFAYTATTGYLSMKNEEDKVMAKIFYVAYTRDDANNDEKRPVTFVFNGGPGSAAIWLHMGGFSPVRVNFADDKGTATGPPYSYGDNPYSWIGFTDLVYIDPVSTGYSRAAKGVDAKLFHGYTEDVQSVGDFIRLFVTRFQRWDNPKFIAGESYGTTRAAGLSGYLQEKYGMYLNGITLISSVLNFQLIDFHTGNEMPYIFFLPTYSTTAQYYHKLSDDLQALSVDALARKAEAFAKKTYTDFLMQGNDVSEALKNSIIDSLHYFTGLSKDYIRKANCRINDFRFFKELLRDSGKITGRYDSRFSGEDNDDAGEYPSYDPSDANLNGLFISAFNTYVRKDLGYKNDLPYNATTSVWPWDYKPAENRYLDVSETLRSAMTQNSHLKVMVCCGYYDLATPLYNAEYVVQHLGLRDDVKNNIQLTYYTAGHMVYINKPDNAKLQKDAENFYADAVK
ncbi:S10 family peptidase [Parafilimonas sp.]|uniref:S10 family peptidase n=1 Tax=Parafilimonas sp. TaxID=1969739 RepID=UPI0039E2FB0F